MDWITAAVQQTSTSASPVWLAPLLGGVGALVGGSLTSTVSWRVLSDTKQARKRTEEKEATATITAALLKARQEYMNDSVAVGTKATTPDRFSSWQDYFHSILGVAEVALLTFENEALRERLAASLELLIWGAYDSRLLYETRLGNSSVVAFAAYQDALACLGANLRREAMPEPKETWATANRQLEWQFELVRRAEEGK